MAIYLRLPTNSLLTTPLPYVIIGAMTLEQEPVSEAWAKESCRSVRDNVPKSVNSSCELRAEHRERSVGFAGCDRDIAGVLQAPRKASAARGERSRVVSRRRPSLRFRNAGFLFFVGK